MAPLAAQLRPPPARPPADLAAHQRAVARPLDESDLVPVAPYPTSLKPLATPRRQRVAALVGVVAALAAAEEAATKRQRCSLGSPNLFGLSVLVAPLAPPLVVPLAPPLG